MSSFFSSLKDRFDVDVDFLSSTQRQQQEDNSYQYELLGTNTTNTNDNDTTSNTSNNDQLPSIDEMCSFCPQLSFQERLGGCLGCMTLGYILSFGSFFRLRDLMLGDPAPFVTYATMGNIISLSGSFFLSGPKSQFEKMWSEKRRIATIVYITSLVVTLIVAFAWTNHIDIDTHDDTDDGNGDDNDNSTSGSGGGRGMMMGGIKAMVLILLLIFQYIAVAWYCMSYIPFARQMATRVFTRLYAYLDV